MKELEKMSDESPILLYFYCKNCMKNKPEGQSVKEYSRIECGWTNQGFNVDCIRCGKKIVHIDFMGQKVDII